MTAAPPHMAKFPLYMTGLKLPRHW